MGKKEEILEAVKSGISKRKLDVAGKGVGITKLEKGGNLSEEKLEKIYATLQEIKGNKITQDNKETSQVIPLEENRVTEESQAQDNKITIPRKKARKESEVNAMLEARLLSLEIEHAELKKQYTSVLYEINLLRGERTTRTYTKKGTSEPAPQEPICGQVDGFKIVRKTINKKYQGKVTQYVKFCATSYLQGKQEWVYLGDHSNTSEEIARAKIGAYLTKKGIQA